MPSGDPGGTVLTIDWTSDGIKQSVQNQIPILGPAVISTVITHPSDGTIELDMHHATADAGRVFDLDVVPRGAVSEGNLEAWPCFWNARIDEQRRSS